MTCDGLSKLPFWRWPAVSLPHEPAHGFFVRIAEMNGARSVRAYANYVGLNGQHFNPSEMLALCKLLELETFDALHRATPFGHVRGCVSIGGIKLGTGNFSLGRPRVCDACLGEAAYYRNWWDISVLERCPTHDRPLIGARNGGDLSWSIPRVGVTRRGEFLGANVTAPLIQPRDTFDSYLLGRLEILPAHKNSTLDSMNLEDVIRAAEIVGRAATHGWSERWPRQANRWSANRRAEIARGYLILRDGQVGLMSFLESYTQARKTTDCTSPTFAIGNFYGWLHNALATMQGAPRRYLAGVMRSFAAERGIFSRKAPKTEVSTEEELLLGPMTLRRLSAHLNLSEHKAEELTFKLGLHRKIFDRARNHAFGPEQVRLLKDKLNDLITRADAARALGLSTLEFSQICGVEETKPFIRIGCSSRAGDRFARQDIDAILSKIKSVPKVAAARKGVSIHTYARATRNSVATIFAQVVSGEISLIGWDENKAGIGGAVLSPPPLEAAFHRRPRKAKGATFFEAAAKLNIGRAAIAPLVAAGYLELEKCSERGARLQVKSLELFEQRYAAAKLYAEVVGSGRSGAAAKLKALGVRVHRVRVYGSYFCFVERADARVKLSLASDPDVPTPGSPGDFWRALNCFLTSNDSPVRALGEAGDYRGRLTSADRRCACTLVTEPSGLSFILEIVANRRNTGRQYTRLSAQLADLKFYWPEATVAEDHSTESILLTERRTVAAPDRWLDTFRWIDNRMRRLRGLLGDDRQVSAQNISIGGEPALLVA